jgi:hypothetical protein
MPFVTSQPLGLNSHIVHFYPDTSLLPEGLHNLNLQIDPCYTLSPFIRRLQNFATVRTLSITTPVQFFSAKEDWLEADSLLAEVGSEIEELHVNFNRLRYQQQDEIERVLRASMPTMNAKGIVCIFFSQGTYFPNDLKLSYLNSSFTPCQESRDTSFRYESLC